MRPVFICACIAVSLSAAPEAALLRPLGQQCTPAEIDHVPIAVRSLEEAERTYQRLGFRLKPGRSHANGLRNSFAKLPRGDYLELISPESGATDEQTQRYVDQLVVGEGGSWLALKVDSLHRAAADLEAAGLPIRLERYGSAFVTLDFSAPRLRWIFLIEYLTPVEDLAELLAHPNTATGIETVWLAEHHHSSLQELSPPLCFSRIGVAPASSGAATIRGLTLRVRSVDAAREVLRTGRLDLPIREDARGRSVLVPASEAHGTWIEFLELAEGIARARVEAHHQGG